MQLSSVHTDDDNRRVASLSTIAYETSVRALAQQEAALNELRSRTALLVAGSALASSLTSNAALNRGAPRGLVIAALAAFGVAVLLAVFVVVPRKGLIFAVSGSKAFEALWSVSADEEEVYRRLAYWLDGYWDANQKVLERLQPAFTAGCYAIVAGIAALAVAIGVTLK